MPLLDHFHPPLAPTRSWEGLHTQWAGSLVYQINRQLPEAFFAEPQVHLGTQIEIDVATFERDGVENAPTLPLTWRPPPASNMAPFAVPETVEVLVLGSPRGGDRTLVAAIELVSPSNKDGPDSRQAFVIKCASYLQAGCGLMVIDVVSNYTASLHNELADLLGVPQMRFAPVPQLYLAAYHPRRNDEREEVEVWTRAVTLGQLLPTMPLWLRGFGPLPIDLEATYHEACICSRLVPRPAQSAS